MKPPTNKHHTCSPKATDNRARPRLHCGPAAAPCLKCALFMIIAVRFRAFEQRFGRSPAPDEPLFFVSAEDHPVAVELPEAIEQILAAASQLGIDASPVLQFLNLNSVFAEGASCAPADTARRLTRIRPPSRKRVRPKGRDGGSTPGKAVTATRQAASDKPGVWKQFMNDHETHRRCHITDDEFAMLSQIALVGEVIDQRDFIFILETVRHSAGNPPLPTKPFLPKIRQS